MSLREVFERLAIYLPDDTLEALLIHSKKQKGQKVQLRLLSGWRRSRCSNISSLYGRMIILIM
ncbi:hypothetical protein ACXHJ2_16050 [Paenibacillus sp. ALE3]|uniref:hypothetical protein n=1 Tax=Paenibacillus sp. EKM202P TaxID=1683670 RepID=UPI001EEB0D4A|nr:hypothetical protein [Paenibacillus sp. EKM202P]